MSEREVYIDKLAEELKEWDKQIERLQDKGKQAKGDVEKKYADEVQKLRSKRDALENKLDQLRASTNDAWQELKPGLEKSWAELKNSITSAVGKFKPTI